MKVLSKRWLLGAAALVIAAAAAATGGPGARRLEGRRRPRRRDSGRLSGLLPRDHLTEESAIQVDLSKETVRLPLYKGQGANGETVWYVLLDASDAGHRPRPRRQLRAEARQPRASAARSACRR